LSRRPTDLRYVDFLDFDSEVWTLVHYDACFALLRNVIGLFYAV
jgi:hypothetical protein